MCRGAERLSKDEAVEFLEALDKQGYVHSVWFHPLPYVGGLCACEYPSAAGCGCVSTTALKFY